MSKMLENLKKQLSSAGLENPESFEKDEPQLISTTDLNAVSGGFGQLVGFQQLFDQNVGPGTFVQTIFTQRLG